MHAQDQQKQALQSQFRRKRPKAVDFQYELKSTEIIIVDRQVSKGPNMYANINSQYAMAFVNTSLAQN